MKTNLIPQLRNGLDVAFSALAFDVHPFEVVTLNGYDVTLGHTLKLSARELHEIDAKLFAEVDALAMQCARAEYDSESRDMTERRAWFERGH